MNKNCVAMLLAGGQGSRLYALTNKIAKPAVPFGAKYRIIDFPLSNCVNSNIDTVGVLTQYQPLILNEYIGNGQPWDLDRNFGGVHILPPYQEKASSEWYKGTANAIYQNINFIKLYNPEYVLVLSGDHIYKMDYSLMVEQHEKTNADCTISVIDVTLEEASRFGIMSTDETGKITSFEEKPKVPKGTKASMGIYVFSAKVLFEYLTKDEKDEKSSKDFGKDIIPKMLKDGKNMMSYEFKGYWKDVGTIKSLFDANMDLLGEVPAFDIFDSDWRIYSRNPNEPPHYIGDTAVVNNSIIALGCEIEGEVVNSVISSGVKIKKNAVVKNSVIMEKVIINEGAVIEHSIIDEESIIGKNAVIGKINDGEIAVIGRKLKISPDTVIKPGEMVEKNI